MRRGEGGREGVREEREGGIIVSTLSYALYSHLWLACGCVN